LKLEQPVASYGSPQVEDGHTRIANELLEQIIKFDFSKRQLKVVLFVIRKTYGYNKKTDQMSISQISAGTGLDHSATVKAVAELVALGVVSKQHGQYAQVIGLNKQYKDWVGGVNLTPSVKTSPLGVSKQHIASVNLTPTKETTKNNTKRHIPEDFGISPRVYDWAKRKGHTDLEAHLENFILTAQANNYTYANWDSAFMRAITDNWAKVQPKRSGVVL
jgi:phage replication O-like protein O